MVSLNKIYTRTGDKGTTMLGDGSRVPKTHLRVRGYGVVDELNASLGLAIAQGQLPEPVLGMVTTIQNELFDLGSDLCTPHSKAELAGQEKRGNRLKDARHKDLEARIDQLQEDLQPLTSFVLPGGSPAGSWLHLARTVCRRAELEVLALSEAETINQACLVYLNRLSDLLFVMARWCNREQGETLWVPGKSDRSEDQSQSST